MIEKQLITIAILLGLIWVIYDEVKGNKTISSMLIDSMNSLNNRPAPGTDTKTRQGGGDGGGGGGGGFR